MTSSSPWQLETAPLAFPTLKATLEVDVVIIGGGITGVVTAYELTKAGKKVALLEQGSIVGGASGWTTAFITQVTDASLTELQATFGAERAAMVWKNGAHAIDEIERIVRTEAIDCEFLRCPAYIFATDEEALKKLHEEEELAKSMGFSAQIQDAALGFATPGYLRVEQQAKFHPVKFLSVLARKTAALGAQIFENSKVLSYEGTSPCIVKTAEGEIHTKHIVLATEMPSGDPDAISARITAYQTYALEATIPSGTLPEALFWDTEKPYHYFRVDRFATHDRLILGGEDHKTGQSADTKTHAAHLETFLKKLLPNVTYHIVRTWSGEILETIDGLPFIGKSHKNSSCLLATGFSGNGMTFGVLSALITRDLILGKETEMTTLYKTLRFSGFWHLMQRGYTFLTQWIKGRAGHETETVQNIKPDDGAIVALDGKKVAVYKDAAGKIHKLSPVCTHLGCHVAWNTSDKTWDCPCHGSRFNKDGAVLNGPASKPLKKM